MADAAAAACELKRAPGLQDMPPDVLGIICSSLSLQDRFNLAFNRKSLFFSLLDRHLLYSNIKCTRITARGLLLSLQRYRPWIVEIEPYTVRHLVAVGGDHILAILAPRCEGMRRLVIKSTSDVLPPKLKGLRDSYGGYTAPPARLPWLRHNTSITSFELEVGRGADNLEHLPVSLESCVLRLGRRFTNDHLSGMSRLSRLTTLLLHGGSDQMSLNLVTALRTLHNLAIEADSKVESIAMLGELPFLTCLNVVVTAARSHLPDGLGSCTQLRELEVQTVVPLADADGLQHLTGLTALHLSQCGGGLWHLPEQLVLLTSLQQLVLRGAAGSSFTVGAGYGHLPRRLTSLLLDRVADCVPAGLQPHPSLEALEIRERPLSTDSLANLPPTLTRLSFATMDAIVPPALTEMRHMRELSISGRYLRDGFEYLPPNLTCLELKDNIGLHQVPDLDAAFFLAELDISGCRHIQSDNRAFEYLRCEAHAIHTLWLNHVQSCTRSPFPDHTHVLLGPRTQEPAVFSSYFERAFPALHANIARWLPPAVLPPA